MKQALWRSSSWMDHVAAPKNRLARALAAHPKVLVCYFSAGDPLMPLEVLDVFASCGVDIVEIGIRSDDPYLDGDIIRQSTRRSTGKGVLSDASEAVARLETFHGRMAGLVFAYASDALLASAVEGDWRGIDALMCAPETRSESKAQIELAARNAGVRITEFVSYDCNDHDVRRAVNATGYVMLQCVNGKTGLYEGFDGSAAARVARLRAAGVSKPILLGIGIGTADQCRQAIDSGADGVVIGSKVVATSLQSASCLEAYLASVRRALDG